MQRNFIPYKSIRRCLGLIITIAVLAILFAAGMGAYAGIAKISYGQAWINLADALRALFTLISNAIHK